MSEMSEEVRVTTDSTGPGPPTITHVNCSGQGDLCVEWTKPKGDFVFYTLYYKSAMDQNHSKTEVTISEQGQNVYCLRNLTNFTTFSVAMSTSSQSLVQPDKYYESSLSSPHTIFLSPDCDTVPEMVTML